MSLTGYSHPIVTRGSRVSCALPHHTLPAFLNLHGSREQNYNILLRIAEDMSAKCMECNQYPPNQKPPLPSKKNLAGDFIIFWRKNKHNVIH